MLTGTPGRMFHNYFDLTLILQTFAAYSENIFHFAQTMLYVKALFLGHVQFFSLLTSTTL